MNGRSRQPAVPEHLTFEEAFSAAVDVSGLSLRSLAHRLQQQGHRITDATLSYWRSGARQPGRHSSTEVVRALEEILDVESGSLLALIPGTEERGRGARREPLGSDLANYPERIEQLRRALGVTRWPSYRIVMTHEEVTLDHRGVRCQESVHFVIQAKVDELRSIVVGQVDHSGVDGPGTLLAPSVGWVRATAVDRDMRILMSRIDLPAPIRRLDTFSIRVDTQYPLACARTHGQERWSEYSMREHVLNVQFHPDMPPSRVESFTSPTALDAEPRRTRTGRLLGDTLAQAIHLNVPPGSSGMNWRFADEGPDGITAADGPVPTPAPEVLLAWQELRPVNEVSVAPVRSHAAAPGNRART